jgi:hypothetical protein
MLQQALDDILAPLDNSDDDGIEQDDGVLPSGREKTNAAVHTQRDGPAMTKQAHVASHVVQIPSTLPFASVHHVVSASSMVPSSLAPHVQQQAERPPFAPVPPRPLSAGAAARSKAEAMRVLQQAQRRIAAAIVAEDTRLRVAARTAGRTRALAGAGSNGSAATTGAHHDIPPTARLNMLRIQAARLHELASHLSLEMAGPQVLLPTIVGAGQPQPRKFIAFPRQASWYQQQRHQTTSAATAAAKTHTSSSRALDDNASRSAVGQASSVHFHGGEDLGAPHRPRGPAGGVYDIYSPDQPPGSGPVGMGMLFDDDGGKGQTDDDDDTLENDGIVKHERPYPRPSDQFYPRASADARRAILAAAAKDVSSRGMDIPTARPIRKRMMVSRILRLPISTSDDPSAAVSGTSQQLFRKHVLVEVADIWGLVAARHALPDMRDQVVDWSRIIQEREAAEAAEARQREAPMQKQLMAAATASDDDEVDESSSTFMTATKVPPVTIADSSVRMVPREGQDPFTATTTAAPISSPSPSVAAAPRSNPPSSSIRKQSARALSLARAREAASFATDDGSDAASVQRELMAGQALALASTLGDSTWSAVEAKEQPEWMHSARRSVSPPRVVSSAEPEARTLGVSQSVPVLATSSSPARPASGPSATVATGAGPASWAAVDWAQDALVSSHIARTRTAQRGGHKSALLPALPSLPTPQRVHGAASPAPVPVHVAQAQVKAQLLHQEEEQARTASAQRSAIAAATRAALASPGALWGSNATVVAASAAQRLGTSDSAASEERVTELTLLRSPASAGRRRRQPVAAATASSPSSSPLLPFLHHTPVAASASRSPSPPRTIAATGPAGPSAFLTGLDGEDDEEMAEEDSNEEKQRSRHSRASPLPFSRESPSPYTIVEHTVRSPPPRVLAHSHSTSSGNYAASPAGKLPINKTVAHLPPTTSLETRGVVDKLAETQALLRLRLAAQQGSATVVHGARAATAAPFASMRGERPRRPDRTPLPLAPALTGANAGAHAGAQGASGVLSRVSSSPPLLVAAGGSKYLSAAMPGWKTVLAPMHIAKQTNAATAAAATVAASANSAAAQR